MLYGLQFVDKHPIYRLHEAAEFFFDHGLNLKSFGDACFPKWFVVVLNDCPALKKQFRDVFREGHKQEQAIRDSVLRVWKCHNDVKTLCDNINVKVEKWNFAEGKLTSAIETLFETLYKETLGRVSFQKAVGSTFVDHYNSFRELGQRVCPFCGLAPYKDRGAGIRASYDHYLPRSYYPFGAVNFKNVIPMCDECNQAPNKGTTDIIYADRCRTKRRTFFYPYSKVGGILIGLDSVKPDSLGNPGKWKISAKPKLPIEIEQVKAWKAVFHIETRYANRLMEESEYWVKEFLKTKAYVKPPSIKALRDDFLQESTWWDKPEQASSIAASALRAAYFKFLAKKAKKEQIAGLARASTSFAIFKIPVAAGGRR